MLLTKQGLGGETLLDPTDLQYHKSRKARNLWSPMDAYEVGKVSHILNPSWGGADWDIIYVNQIRNGLNSTQTESH